jgi:serine/threonine-protein kinase RsbW
MLDDRITLTVPARGEYAKVVRMTAAALVSRMSMTIDDVDDIRMAAEEAFVYAADTVAEGDPVTFVFDIGEDEIALTVPLGSEDQLTDEEVERRTSYATFILESVCDNFELATGQDGTAVLRILKRSGTVDAV